MSRLLRRHGWAYELRLAVENLKFSSKRLTVQWFLGPTNLLRAWLSPRPLGQEDTVMVWGQALDFWLKWSLLSNSRDLIPWISLSARSSSNASDPLNTWSNSRKRTRQKRRTPEMVTLILKNFRKVADVSTEVYFGHFVYNARNCNCKITLSSEKWMFPIWIDYCKTWVVFCITLHATTMCDR